MYIFAYENKGNMTENNVIGYFKFPLKFEHFETDPILQRMKGFRCTMMFYDDINERSEWIKFHDRLKEGDSAVLYSIFNAFRFVDELMRFLKYCDYMNIRIISIEDEIDTDDQLWPASTWKILKVIMNLSTKMDSGRYNDYKIDFLTDNVSIRRARKVASCINMLNAHFTYAEIMKQLGYKSKKSIWNIMNKYCVRIGTRYLPRGSIKS